MMTHLSEVHEDTGCQQSRDALRTTTPSPPPVPDEPDLCEDCKQVDRSGWDRNCRHRLSIVEKKWEHPEELMHGGSIVMYQTLRRILELERERLDVIENVIDQVAKRKVSAEVLKYLCIIK